jgi:hypothetical protein
LPVDEFEQTFLAADQQLLDFDLRHVPLALASLVAQHIDAAVPGLLLQNDAGVHEERGPISIAMRSL